MPKRRTVEKDRDRVKRLARQADKLVREQTLSTQTNADLLRVLLERAALTEQDYMAVSSILMQITYDSERVHKRVRDRANTMLGYLTEHAERAGWQGP